MDEATSANGSRFSLPAHSPLTELASKSAECDRIQFSVIESLADYALTRACAAVGLPMDSRGREAKSSAASPRFATVADSVLRTVPRPASPDPWADSDTAAVSMSAGAAASPEADMGETADVALFPGFEPDEGFSAWTCTHLAKDDLRQITAILGTTIGRAKRKVGTAMTLVHGLPQFCQRVRAGEFTAAHVEVVMYACDTLAMRHLPVVDRYLKQRRADVTCETLKRTLLQQIMVIQPPVERYQEAAQRRRVEINNRPDGSSCLLLHGPTLEINACYQRVRAMARSVYTNQTSAFGLARGTVFVDERGMDNLMFDIMTRSLPSLVTRTTAVDPVTGVPTTIEEPFDLGSGGAPAGGSGGEASTGSVGGHCFASPGGGREPEVVAREVVLTLPTSQWWMANQGGVIATVPFLSAYGESLLPGQLPDGSPIPAETARRLVGNCSSLYRVLTDPASGTPLDAKAWNYRIPRSVRTTVVSQWMLCSTPGCTQQAVFSEIDHVVPFDHEDPQRGGSTSFGNLHPLCRSCHGLKTAGVLSVRMPESGKVEFGFAQGLATTVFVPDSPIDAAQALRLWELGQKSATAEWTLPPPGTANDLQAETEGPRTRAKDVQTRAEVHGNGLRNAAGESSAGESSGQGSVKYAGPSDSCAVRRIAERVAENYLAVSGPLGSAPGCRATKKLQRGEVKHQGEESVEIRASVGDASPEPGSGCRPPTSSLPEICVKRRFTRTFSSSDRFGAPVIGAEIVEYDPLIVMATKGMNIDGSPLYSVFARNRREELLSHLEAADDGATDSGSTDSGATDTGSGGGSFVSDSSDVSDRDEKRSRGTSDRSVIDWNHKFDDDPPPF